MIPDGSLEILEEIKNSIRGKIYGDLNKCWLYKRIILMSGGT